MNTATQQPSKSASAAAEISKAIPAKRARPSTQKVGVKSAPARKAAAKRIAVKKVTAKARPSPKVGATAPPKAKKDKLIRDSFTIPKAEYAVIDALKQRSITLVRPAKRSELLRAGIKVLAGLSDAALLAALGQVPTIKTGRPALKK